MSTKFVWILILCGLIVRSEFLIANAARSCKNKNPDINLNPILAQGGLDFSINLYKQFENAYNVLISPFSVRVALAMTAEGAVGPTLTQMNTVLGLNKFQSKDQIDQAFQNDLDSFCPNSNYALSMANRIYVQKDFSISKSFIKKLKRHFLSSAEHVNFGTKVDDTAKKINSWVEKQTNHKVKNFIKPISLKLKTGLLLINAISFKGKWKTRFDPEDTKPRDFNKGDDNLIKVPTMYTYSDFKISHSKALKSRILQMNYNGDRLAMHIILPEEGTNLKSVKRNLNPKNVNDYIDDLVTRDVKVYLPRFESNYKDHLSGILEVMGMTKVFDNSANFTKITPDGRVFVSDVIHQAYVQVDEDGTTAAAATTSADGASEFRVNRPCIYLIYDQKFKQILLMGNLDDPST